MFAFIAFEPLSGEIRRPFVSNDMVVLARPILPSISSPSAPYLYDPSSTGSLYPELHETGVFDGDFFPLYSCMVEGFSGAFRCLREEEAGRATALVDSGTRILLRLFNVPPNVKIFVSLIDLAEPWLPPNHGGIPARPAKSPVRAMLVDGADPNGAGGKAIGARSGPAGLPPVVEVVLSGGFGFAVWEWVAAGGPERDPRAVSLGVVCSSVAAGNEVVSRTSQWCSTLAPISTVVSAGSAPVPRFIDLCGDPDTFFSQLGPEIYSDDDG